jgi:hypothetical protein
MRHSTSSAWSFVKKLYAFYLPIRFSFIALGVLIFAFWFSDQGEDILRALADDPVHHSWIGRTAMLLVASNLLAYAIWYWSRQLLRFRPYVTRDECRDPVREPLPVEMKRATDRSPRLLGLAVFLVEIVGWPGIAAGTRTSGGSSRRSYSSRSFSSSSCTSAPIFCTSIRRSDTRSCQSGVSSIGARAAHCSRRLSSSCCCLGGRSSIR